MADGGTIGAAMPVEMGLPGAPAQPVAEKTVSYMRKEFRATAESRKRPPLLAAAMADADVEIPGVIEKGKLLTLTTEEAVQHQLADVRADSLAALLRSLALLRVLPRLPWGHRLVLETELLAGAGGASAPAHDRRWLGKGGTAATPLRPAGVAHLDGERVDVVSEGEFIEAGQSIAVIRVDGNRIVVRRMHAPNTQE
jgi:membrane-bound ClpP family serine protease